MEAFSEETVFFESSRLICLNSVCIKIPIISLHESLHDFTVLRKKTLWPAVKTF